MCKQIQGQTKTHPETPFLKSFRINYNHAFENGDVDYVRPILLITCVVASAVHIEVKPVVENYSLKLALSRFFLRSEVSKVIINDNSKSFKSFQIF